VVDERAVEPQRTADRALVAEQRQRQLDVALAVAATVRPRALELARVAVAAADGLTFLVPAAGESAQRRLTVRP